MLGYGLVAPEPRIYLLRYCPGRQKQQEIIDVIESQPCKHIANNVDIIASLENVVVTVVSGVCFGFRTRSAILSTGHVHCRCAGSNRKLKS